jgi:hypothetical protein
MAYTDINNPELYFNTVLYSGTGSNQSVTGTGFTADWIWLKERNGTDYHFVNDSVRGKGSNNHYLNLHPNATSAESDQTTGVNAINSNGFDITYRGELNESGKNYVAWNWLAGGSASSNSNGSITSTVSSNTTAGFSIVSYTGTGANATIGHGLGVAPSWIITKNRDATQPWRIYHKALGATFGMILNDTSVKDDDNTAWNDTEPTSSVFSVGSSANTNNGSDDFIAYCFAEKKGYSKFGGYTGNGNADGTFIYTGFKPSFVLQTKTSGTSDWVIYDNKRDPSNIVTQELKPNSSGAESSFTNIDILSNGFKQRANYAYTNNSGGSYIYMAFAESPFVNSNGVPNNAR